MRKFWMLIIIALQLFILIFAFEQPAKSETLYVSIREDTYLNGRERPSTKSFITMRLFNGDVLEAITFDGEWVEVVGGESGTSFVKAEYLSELKIPVFYTNVSGGRVRVRKTPQSSKTVAWIASNDTIKISRKIMDWGYTHGGWVNLSYFEKKETD